MRLRLLFEDVRSRIAVWRCRWFPYRTVELIDVGEYGPTRWQWPDVFGRPLR